MGGEIQGYGTAPVGGWPTMNFKRRKEMTFGWEYEIDCLTDVGMEKPPLPFPDYKYSKWYNWSYESLTYPRYGWEVKSHIAPLRIHQIMTRAWIRDTKFNTNKNGKKSNAGGIHVNINRDEFGIAHHEPVFKYLHGKENFDFLLKLSRRHPNSFRSYAPQKHDHWNNQYNKYQIITVHKKTCWELRMFAAHPDLLIPAVEFSDALFHCVADNEGKLNTELLYKYTGSFPKYRGAHKLIHETLDH